MPPDGNMGLYTHIKQNTIDSYKNRSDTYRQRLIDFNRQPTITRVGKPTNIARARKLGYRAKQGVIVVRVGLIGGSSKRKTAAGGRKPSKSGRYFTRHKSLISIADGRASRKFSNCEVLNSYFVGKSGSKSFFEVILLERANPSVLSDKIYGKIVSSKGRAMRGLTSAGRSHRGFK